MIPGSMNEEVKEGARKGDMPIQGALMSELLLWQAGAQSRRGHSEESFEKASKLPP